VAVTAAYDGAAGFCCWAARGGWRLGGIMATVELESVTTTVIDLYVYWKLGFMLNLEAWLSTGLSAVGVLDALGVLIECSDWTALDTLAVR